MGRGWERSGRQLAGAAGQAHGLVDQLASEPQILLRDREGQAVGSLTMQAPGTGETGGGVGQKGHAAHNSCAAREFRGSSHVALGGCAVVPLVDEHLGIGELEQHAAGARVVARDRDRA